MVLSQPQRAFNSAPLGNLFDLRSLDRLFLLAIAELAEAKDDGAVAAAYCLSPVHFPGDENKKILIAFGR